MKVPERTWIRYIEALRKINDAAADAMEKYLQTHPLETVADKLTASEYAYALATQFGEGAAAMACEMYDAMAAASGAALPAAEPAAAPTLKDVKDTIFGSTSKYKSAGRIPGEIGRLVKRTGVDTTMQNAIRDKAEWAWVPHGDTCPFCIALASRGWQEASRAAMKGNHAEHIHANCDCTYAIRFNKKTEYAGYDPERYADIYNNAEGRSAREKINSLKRAQYAENAPRIRAQKRAAYAERTFERKLDSMAQEDNDARVPAFIKGDYSDFEQLRLSRDEIEIIQELDALTEENNAEYGRVIYNDRVSEIFTSGSPHHVNIPLEPDAIEASVYHTHTNVTPPSRKDFEWILKPQVGKFGVKTKNGDVFTVEVGDGWIPSIEEYNDIVDEIRIQAYNDIKTQYAGHNLGADEMFYLAEREQAYRISRYFGWTMRGGTI